MKTAPRPTRFVVQRALLVGAAVLFDATTARSSHQPPQTDPATTRIEIAPAEIVLSGPDATQQLVVTGFNRDGRAADLTRDVTYRVSDSVTAQLRDAVLTPVRDGTTTLIASYGDLTAQVPVRVERSAIRRTVSFENEVIPVLTKAGCNSGGCHGKASGQNGFKLSVFGFDPRGDFDALIKETRGRRVFAAAPKQSLLLRKATGQIPHGGGIRLTADSNDYATLRTWIAQGAPPRSDAEIRIRGIDVWPAERSIAANASQQLIVTATFSDGSRRDVTSHAEFSSNAEAIAAVDETGLIRASEVPGEAAIMVRYMGQVAVNRVIRPQTIATEFPSVPVNNFVDDRTWTRLRKLGIVPSQLCSDTEFLRRASLDTIGTLPTSDEARRFIADSDPDKRARLVDRLLERPEFADYWALRWGDVLRVDSAAVTPKGAYVFHHWLRDVVARNRPYDEIVREILTASGDPNRVGPANLYRAVKTPEELANTVSQVFLGVRIECAQCHHHPYERWGQDDFYGLAAYFAQLKRKGTLPGQELLLVSDTGDVKHPTTNLVVLPKPLGDATATRSAGDRRDGLAAWLTAPTNPFFARMVANRIWAHFLGRGLVEPVDDMRTTNPASNEPLLEALAQFVVEKRYDLRELMRFILNSRVYQLSSRTNPSNALDTQNFSHANVKSMPAEVLLDAISDATGIPEKFDGYPIGVRAIQVWENRLPNYFLEIFGKPVRASVCECERSSEPSMTQALHLLNSPGIERKVTSPAGRARRLLDAGLPDAEIVDELYLTTLARYPTPAERRAMSTVIASRSDRRTAIEDVLWALLNSPEFMFIR